MKKYILVTYTISNIGGGQIYCKNKFNYLKRKGWNVDIYSGKRGDSIMVNELKIFSDNVHQELQYHPFIFSARTQNKIVNKIINSSFLDKDYEELIIESHTIQASIWCELIAKRLNCKHFIYLLQESFGKQSSCVYNFLDYKHKRKELAGINEKSLELLFRNYKELKETEKYSLKAICSTNVVEDIRNPIIDSIEKLDLNIGCISRLQKSFVNTMIDEIVIFAKRNSDKSILLVLVGGAPNIEIEQNIIAKVKDLKNIKLLMTGRLYPIPRKLFEVIDIFIGVAGSARISAYEGVLTMSLDVQTHKPIGLLGLDTQCSLYSEHEIKTTISTSLETILIERELHKRRFQNDIKLEVVEYEKEYDNHLEFLKSSIEDKNYYTILPINIGFKNTLKKLLIKTIKIRRYEGFIRLIQRLKNYKIANI